MTKEELREKRNLAIENLNHAIAILGSDELYIDELEKEIAELKEQVEKHKWNDIFLEDCADYDKKIAEEYTTLQERIERLEKENAELKDQIKKMKCYFPVDERDSNHKWFAYKDLSDAKWHIDYSVQGELPKCNTIKWFENKDAVMFYLVSNKMKYSEEPRG